MPLTAQDTIAVHNGQPVTSDGAALIITASDIPQAPVPPEPDPFDGDVVYQVSFGDLASAQFEMNNDSAVNIFGAGTGRGYASYGGTTTLDSTYADSITLKLNANGVLDTVQRAELVDLDVGAGVVSERGINYKIPIGADYDSLCMTYYVLLSDNFDYSTGGGGKAPGLGARSTAGVDPKTGGVYDCGCGGNDICPGDGFTMRSGYRPVDGDQWGYYTYWEGMTFSGSQAFPTCDSRSGDSWYTSVFHPAEPDQATVVPGVWTKVTTCVLVNSDAALSDGEVLTAINDTVKLKIENKRLTKSNGVFLDFIDWAFFNGGNTPTGAKHWAFFDDLTLWIPNDGFSQYGYGDVMTNVPSLPTPNTTYDYEASIYGVEKMFDENYQALRPAQDDELRLIPSEVWGDKWKGD